MLGGPNKTLESPTTSRCQHLRRIQNELFRERHLLHLFVFSVAAFAISGCGHQKINVQDLLNQPIEEVGHFKSSKKYKKAGITVVFLTGSPYEIGLAHGKLCREKYWK